MNRWSGLALVLAVMAAIAIRAPKLGTRPPHNDEAVNAVKVAELWEKGRYVYDPDEYHGPTLHYATLPVLWLSGARNSGEIGDATLRIAPLIFGVGLILLLPLFVDGIGRHALVWAAFFLALSPAMVFYSRYFIHEMLLVFFTALTLGAGWRYTQKRSAAWAAATGAGVGLMFATKETFVISVVAMVLGAIATGWWTKGSGARSAFDWKHAVLALSAGLVVWVVFFSSFFTNFGGLIDSIGTYLPWLKRAGGHSPHIHPWSFYLQRLAWFHPVKGPIWSEGLILVLAVIGIVTTFVGKQTRLRYFLAFYTVTLTGAYCAISYKTPWCLLNFYFGMILLAGAGAAELVEIARARSVKAVVYAVVLALTAQLSWQAWRASVVYASDRRNPYVYAQTSPDLMKMVLRMEAIARIAPTGFETVIKVVAPQSDYWPLPWSLRRFKHVGWYDKLPKDPFAPMIVASSKLDARLDEKSDKKWIMVGLSEQRPENFFELYVELELWKKYVGSLPPERD